MRFVRRKQNGEAILLESLCAKGFSLEWEGDKKVWVAWNGHILGYVEVDGQFISFNYLAEEQKDPLIPLILEIVRDLRKRQRFLISSCATSEIWEKVITQKRKRVAGVTSTS